MISIIVRIACNYRLGLCLLIVLGIASQQTRSALSAYAGSPHVARASGEPSTYAFINGSWFDGQAFHPHTFYSVNGILTRTAPVTVNQTIDLANGFVVPPFGEAHNHNVEGRWNIDAVIQRYLQDGIFYVKNPNNIQELADQIRTKVNLPTSIDVTFANGGLTAAGGHPIPLYEHILSSSRYAPVIGPLPEGWFNNRAYFVIADERDVHDKWPIITAGKPDFIKTYLVDSEHFEHHRDQVSPYIRKGLDPHLLRRIVDLAHRAGLRVSTHVETAMDFRHAVLAGVDEINHLPGWFVPTPEYGDRARLTDEDAQLAGRRGVVVVTTTVAGLAISHDGHHHPPHGGRDQRVQSHNDFASNATLQSLAREIQRDNLQRLHRYGVKLAIGSDHADTSLSEAMNLWGLKIFDNLTLLKMWCETTPATIFPERKIGRLQEGYEASFLVLKKNPLENFEHVATISMRVKQGHRL
jgi:hypothetical protein